MNFIKRLCCEHEYEFVRNIHGDEINWCGGYRSIWRCKKCGNIQYRDELNPIGSLFCQMLNRKYDKYYEDKFKAWQEENKSSIEDIKTQMTEVELKLCKQMIRYTQLSRKPKQDLLNAVRNVEEQEYIKECRPDFGLKSSKIYYDLYINKK